MKENQASLTAFTVLQGLLYVAKRTQFSALVAQEQVDFAELILSQSAEGKKRLEQIDKPSAKWSVKLREALLLPGITLHYALRKKYIEEAALDAIANGVTQVVNLGAGFDGLAYQLSGRYPDVEFIEVDHPQTHRLKSRALAAQLMGRNNFHFLSVDFTKQELQSALSDSEHFDSSQKTLFISEGVLMYLEQSDIDKMFNAISQSTYADSSVIFTCLEPKGSPKNNMRSLLFGYLKMVGEPIKWMLPSEAVEDFLAQYQCSLMSYAGTEELKQKYVTQPGRHSFHTGEYLVVGHFETKAKMADMD
ncbi:class I SAM-dependent methyltransferase [Shewanella salipaludis]|uniref:S-adenosyl-L-methionine-dependent methyltransferase n=1 Tax=Shewanella salipaludis TaxID=2723052 RepID=A0A972FQ13_9GAMM|nr:SAM-dependent methyltransferase [Shewanella salipaludis]NMH63641.1 SAM-dependent methyltransferase [Shewanella salipaludis]